MTDIGVEFWTPLIGVNSGRIKLRMRLEPFAADGDGESPGGAGGGGGAADRMHQRGTLIVSLRRGSNLHDRHAVKRCRLTLSNPC
jgi:hypothetical protein